MPDTQAIVFARTGIAELTTLSMPPPGPDEIQIRTHYSTISVGTEGWMLNGRFTWSSIPFPYVPGYQRVGTVVALGSNVTDWQIGEPIVACSSSWTDPIPPFSGSHIALANSPAYDVYKLPPNVSEIDASNVVVAQVGYNAASRVTLQGNDLIVVYGDGLIGQFAAQSARARGARVVLVGHRPERLQLAADHSADAVINNHTENVVERVHSLTGSSFVTAVLDTVQREDAQREYLPLLEHGRGQIVYCGFTPTPTWADMALLQQRELTAHFVSGWNRTRIEATLALMQSGALRFQPLITHQVPFTRGPEMYNMLNDKSLPFLGVTLEWKGN